ncbi:MAG: hypothetical protein CMI60_15365 [Parvibaculum sp.]|nr:hypothetical protein [Parvibaculum sp.]
MVKDNFFSQPVGRAVLFLNGFHFGANLTTLNRAANLVPKDVKGFATLVASTPDVTPDAVQDVVNLLGDYAHDAENNLIFKLQNQ